MPGIFEKRRAILPSMELEKIPFIDKGNLEGRALTTLTFYVDGQWKMWFPMPTGLTEINGKPAESDYFAKSPEEDTDIYFEFLNFMVQRACYEDAIMLIGGIRSDIHNLAACLGKLELFHEVSKTRRQEVTRFVSTEVEYIFGVCRSLLDILQQVIARLWKRVSLFDTKIKKKQLPDSFRKMVIRDEKTMTADEIEERWGIPKSFADFYHRHSEFFEILRNYRDEVIHQGKDLNMIFVTDKGFAVRADIQPFSLLNVWREEHMLPNRLASLRPVVACVIARTLRICEEFADLSQRIVAYPPDIAPGFKLYVRGFHNRHILRLETVIDNCSWWGDTDSNGEYGQEHQSRNTSTKESSVVLDYQ